MNASWVERAMTCGVARPRTTRLDGNINIFKLTTAVRASRSGTTRLDAAVMSFTTPLRRRLRFRWQKHPIPHEFVKPSRVRHRSLTRHVSFATHATGEKVFEPFLVPPWSQNVDDPHEHGAARRVHHPQLIQSRDVVHEGREDGFFSRTMTSSLCSLASSSVSIVLSTSSESASATASARSATPIVVLRLKLFVRL